MTRLSSAYRTTATESIVQEASDATEARELILDQVPEGHELIQLDIGKTETGARVTGIIRSTATTPIEAEGADYPSAREALRALVPEGHVGLGIRIVEP